MSARGLGGFRRKMPRLTVSERAARWAELAALLLSLLALSVLAMMLEGQL